MATMKKTIFVTGITGFIGRNLLNHLLVQFDQVINFTRQGTVQVIAKGGISEHEISQEIILSNPPETLVNLATLYEPYPRDDLGLRNLIESNILFPSRVLEALGSINNLKVINALSYHQNSFSVHRKPSEVAKRLLAVTKMLAFGGHQKASDGHGNDFSGDPKPLGVGKMRLLVTRILSAGH